MNGTGSTNLIIQELFQRVLRPAIGESARENQLCFVCGDRAGRIPQKFFKHIESTNGLYEIRIEYQSNIYRVFCCFDEGNVVVLFNGFQKKSQKTPQDEITRALKLMSEYFIEKFKNK